MTTYRERLKAGLHDANRQPDQPELDPNNLPGRHTALDQIATARGHTWQGDNPSIADKQEQLRAILPTPGPANTTSSDVSGLQ